MTETRLRKSRHQRRIERDFITGGRGMLEARPVPSAQAEARAGCSVRDAWVDWLAPRFGNCQAAYFTGTYSDEYGIPNGLMNARNVHHDFRRFLIESNLWDREFINGVEHHRYRDVLHCHAIISGEFDKQQLAALKALWAMGRGHARVLPVLDGCASYVTKYALKNDSTMFDWNLS